MRLPYPKFTQPPEIYEAIIREHRQNGVRMGEFLMACGWTIGDAAWAAVYWDLRTLAAAIVNERAKRNMKLTLLSDDQIAQLKKEIQTVKKTTASLRPKRTTRIIPRTTPRINLRPPNKPENPKA